MWLIFDSDMVLLFENYLNTHSNSIRESFQLNEEQYALLGILLVQLQECRSDLTSIDAHIHPVVSSCHLYVVSDQHILLPY